MSIIIDNFKSSSKNKKWYNDLYSFFERDENFLGVFENDFIRITRKYVDGRKECLRLYYNRIEPLKANKKANLCVVHGFGEHSGRFLDFCEYFALNGFIVHTIDLQGFGYSGGARGVSIIEDMLVDIEILMQQADENLPLFLFGHSMGGCLVLTLGTRNPGLNIAGIIASAPMLGNPADRTLDYFKKKGLIAAEGVLGDFLVNSMINVTALTKENPNILRVYEDKHINPFLTIKMGKSIILTLDKVLPSAPNFNYPLLLFHGDQDKVTSYIDSEKFYKLISSKDKTLKIIPNGYHEMQHDCEAHDNEKMILQWLNQRIKGAPLFNKKFVLNYTWELKQDNQDKAKIQQQPKNNQKKKKDKQNNKLDEISENLLEPKKKLPNSNYSTKIHEESSPKKQQFSRRDKLIQLEKQAQQLWFDHNVYESDIQKDQKKYFLTFPYPYLNGRLHMGHVFTLSKADFAARFARLSNYNVLFPFGFHCTGMPICAAADKLKQELQIRQKSGQNQSNENSPQKMKQYEIMRKLNVPENEIPKFVDPYYWTSYFPKFAINDLKSFGAAIDWRRSFITTDINPYYDSFIQWQFNKLKERGYIVFGKRPSIYCIKDNQMCADHDRSEGEGVGPQEYTLIKLKLLNFKNSVQYVQTQNELLNQYLLKQKVYLVAATLRPETMYGQTNCFVQPEAMYGAYLMKNDEVFICSEHSIRNMAYQSLTKQEKQIQKIADLKGTDLIGAQMKAPLSKLNNIYALPMMNVLMNKGTGIVTSVPSDAPDDWAALRDLQKKSALRKKYDVSESIIDLQPQAIIKIPSMGDMAAIQACEELGIQSQNDKDKLAKAKEKCYQLGFSEGIMMVGKYAGKKVSEAKPLVKQDLIEQNEALIYYEPEDNIISRSGDKCIVALCDQWYLKYSDEQWKKEVLEFVKDNNRFKAYNQIAQTQFEETIDWLKDWGCSRTYGLGTRLPFDKKYLIESLSDSTIYMAYYTISHYLQGDIRGSTPGKLGIESSDLSQEAWDYIFLGHEYNQQKCKISEEKLKILRKEFLYWYPMDLRVSAKDLIRNHLTMSLFNHAAIWRKNSQNSKSEQGVKQGNSLWPCSFFVNGYILVNGAKMSKEKGNFFTVEDMVKKYGADSTRFALAEAGDTIEDANFTEENADEAVLKISSLEMWIKNIIKQIGQFRKKQDDQGNDQLSFFDKAFEIEMKQLYCQTIQNYKDLKFREAVKSGFHEFHIIKENYLINCLKEGPRQDLIIQWIEWQLALLYPIAPHFCEITYKEQFLQLISIYNKEVKTFNYLHEYRYTDINQFEIDKTILKINKVLRQFLRTIRLSWSKAKSSKQQNKKQSQGKQNLQEKQIEQQQNLQTKFSKCFVVYAKDFLDWQKQVFQILEDAGIQGITTPKHDWKNMIKQSKSTSQDIKKKQLQFGQYMIEQGKESGILTFDKRTIEELVQQASEELQLIIKNKAWIVKETGISNIQFIELSQCHSQQDKIPENSLKDVVPGKLQIIYL